eukprot:1928838-Rhodomonas_salina.1
MHGSSQASVVGPRHKLAAASTPQATGWALKRTSAGEGDARLRMKQVTGGKCEGVWRTRRAVAV